tara:strand:+ start:30 stop:461 length:432 start_codon:yes stop_codon:yes gene_type:complete
MTREEKKKIYMKAYRLANKEKIAEQNKIYDRAKYEANKDCIKEQKKLYYKLNKQKILKKREALKDDFHTLYYLPKHNYIGVTNQPTNRMGNHRRKSKRDTTNWATIKTFKTRREALDAEKFYHSIGYEGASTENLNKLINPII